MKPIAALFAGFLGSLALFGSGAAVAVYFLMAGPPADGAPAGDVGESQTVAARAEPSEPAARQIEIPAPGVGEASASEGAGAAIPAVDQSSTASIGGMERTPEPSEEGPRLSEQHMDWCANRYRSYRPRDDSYTPYRGGRQRCVSPYSQAIDEPMPREVSPPPSAADDYAADDMPAYANEGYVEADAAMYISSDHVDYCFARYRSYRPEDNSYQPYGGGPRRQCE